MHSVFTRLYALPALAVFLAACSLLPPQQTAHEKPERLIIHPDGSMVFRDRPIPERDVVIYEDGSGGERAAVRIHMQPLHPDFFRDTIVVERKAAGETGPEQKAGQD